MDKAIREFAEQFAYEPVIEQGENLGILQRYLVCGMGGSHLAAGILKAWDPRLDLLVHKNYGLPDLKEERLVIASSYSGNTEEVLDALQEAGKRELPRAVVATGGKLLEQAKELGLPRVQLPATGIQPRSALGYSLRGLLKILANEQGLAETRELATTLHPEEYEQEGKELAEQLKGKIPVIYSSSQNQQIAYNWKIKFNETGKIPAFWNELPELNHNEMTGFDRAGETRQLSEQFSFVFLADETDHPKIQKRMDVLERLYANRGLPVIRKPLQGKERFFRIFSSLLLADWAAYYTAKHYGAEPEQVPMVEEFKQLI